MCEFHRPLSLKAQRSQRQDYFSFAVERTAKEKLSACANIESISDPYFWIYGDLKKVLIFAFRPLSGKQKIKYALRAQRLCGEYEYKIGLHFIGIIISPLLEVVLLTLLNL